MAQQAPSTLKKPNEIVGVVFAQELDLLARKVFNLLIYHTQNPRAQSSLPAALDHRPGTFWLPLAAIVADVNYNSKDTLRLRKALEKLMGLQIHSEVAQDQRWKGRVLITGVDIQRADGALWVGWTYHGELLDLIVTPNTFTRLAVEQQAQLKSSAGLALWEICRRYASSPSHLTAEQPIEWWRQRLGGGSLEYRYWKRDILAPAMNEVEQVASLALELIEQRQGRRVLSLQFKVRGQVQQSLGLKNEGPLIDSAILGRIVALGLDEASAEKIAGNASPDDLARAITVTEQRLRDTRLTPLKSAAAFFKAALRDGYSPADPKPSVTKDEAAPPKPATTASLPNMENDAEVAHATAALMAMDDATRQALAEEFFGQVKNRAFTNDLLKRGIGPKAKIGWPALANWYSRRLKLEGQGGGETTPG